MHAGNVFSLASSNILRVSQDTYTKQDNRASVSLLVPVYFFVFLALPSL